MTEQKNDSKATESEKPVNTAVSNWGPRLFIAVVVFTLVFFWWLLIYSHGVAPHGG